jgi:hypothetical protein
MLQLLQQQIYVFTMAAMKISKMFCRMGAGKKNSLVIAAALMPAA